MADRQIHLHLNDGHWTATFDHGLPFAFGGNTAAVAIRRLLEATEDYLVRSEVAEPGVPESVTWDSPLLLTKCSGCDGKGQYVGLQLVERCGVCNGRGVQLN